MGRLWYVPLEDAPQRYTRMMNESVRKLTDAEVVVPAENIPQQFSARNFLDPCGTIKFKARQVESIVALIEREEIKTGDALLFGDVFFPGLEGIAYAAELKNIKLNYFGWNYAGRADATDLTQGLGAWADKAEAAWHNIMDAVFVGSEYHNRNVRTYFRLPRNRVITTGYVLCLDWIERQAEVEAKTDAEIINRVIWPHRICEEKGFDDMLRIAKAINYPVLITSSGNAVDGVELPSNVSARFNISKKEYYTALRQSRWYLSTAYQETFGYTLQEAIQFGCHILAPNRACYPEMVPHVNLYADWVDAAARINSGRTTTVPRWYVERWNNNATVAVEFCRALMNLSVSCVP